MPTREIRPLRAATSSPLSTATSHRHGTTAPSVETAPRMRRESRRRLDALEDEDRLPTVFDTADEFGQVSLGLVKWDRLGRPQG